MGYRDVTIIDRRNQLVIGGPATTTHELTDLVEAESRLATIMNADWIAASRAETQSDLLPFAATDLVVAARSEQSSDLLPIVNVDWIMALVAQSQSELSVDAVLASLFAWNEPGFNARGWN